MPLIINLTAISCADNQVAKQSAACSGLDQAQTITISRIHESDIEKNKTNLVIELKRTSMLRACLNAGITVVAFYAIYKIFIEREPEIISRRNSNVEGELLPAMMNERMNNIQDRFDDFIRLNNPGWFTWQWCQNWTYSIGRGLMSMVATKTVFDAGDHVYQNVYNPGTVQWFIGSHTQLVALCNELQEYAQKYDRALTACSNETQVLGFYVHEICHVMNTLVKHCGSIIAFMEVSIDGMPEKGAERNEAKEITSYLRYMVNDFATAMEHAVNRQDILVPTIAQFTADFGRTMMSFNRIEKPIEI